jgi:hypothetical protein
MAGEQSNKERHPGIMTEPCAAWTAGIQIRVAKYVEPLSKSENAAPLQEGAASMMSV